MIEAMSKLKQEIYWVIEAKALDQIIEKEYGRRFSCIADLELYRDTCYSLSIQRETLGNLNRKDLEVFIMDGVYSWLTHTILIDMCNRDLIPEGNYLIKV